MSGGDAQARLDDVIERIAQTHGARYDSYEDDGEWLVSLERLDDPVVLVRGSGRTENAAKSDLISNAQKQGLIEK